MPIRSFPISIILLLFCMSAPGQTQNALPDSVLSLHRQEARLAGDGTTGPYQLPDSFILVESEEIRIGPALQKREIDYTIDCDDGQILFSRPVSEGSEIHIRYSRLPLGLKRSYQLIQPEPAQSPSRVLSPSQGTGPLPQLQSEKTSLKIGGSKSLGISLGSDRDLSLEQSLRLNITGQLARDVEVVALLSDQSSPLQPEGTTQTLEELDKVSIELRGKHLQAAFGDYALVQEQTEFARLNRKLEGVLGQLRLPSSQVSVAGASSKGVFFTNRFTGIEGNQGPYQLETENGTTEFIVLAGTEKVWIDGELMSRGENNDYIIEYGNGQITFTRNRLVTADSRMIVDFEYMDEAYRRTLYAGSGLYSLTGEKFQFGAAYVHESDDEDDPLAMTLSDDDRALLAAAGDSAGEAFYYTDDSTKVWLPLPRSHSLADFNLSISSNVIRASGEMGFSHHDQNTLSPLDDSNNDGQAYKVSATLQTPSLMLGGRRLGTLEMSALQRRLDETFRSLGRTEIVEYNRRWDLPEDFEDHQQEVRELVTSYRAGESTVGFSVGQLQSGSEFESSRKELQADLKLHHLPSLSYLGEAIDSRNQHQGDFTGGLENTWLRHALNSQYDVGNLQSNIAVRGERKEEHEAGNMIDGFKFYEMGGDISAINLRPFRVFASLLFRKDWAYDGSWLEASRSQTLKQGLSLDSWRSFSSSIEYTHRRKQFGETGGVNQTTDLADIRMNYAPLDQAITSSLRYQISGLQAARQERQFIDVGTWQGNYRYDEVTGEYIYDPGREESRFLLTTKTAGDFEPVIELNAGLNLRIQPERYYKRSPHGSTLAAWLSMMESETTIDIREKTKEKDRWSIYLFDMSTFQQDSTTVDGRIRLRQDLIFFPRVYGMKVRLRYEKNDDESNQFLNEENTQVIGEERLRTEHSLRTQAKITMQCDLQVELKKERIRRQVQQANTYDVDSRSLAADIGLRPQRPLELSLKALWDRDEDHPSGQQSMAITLMPGVSYAIPEKGRVRASTSWTHVSVKDRNLPLFYTMAGSKPAGDNFDWSISIDYRFHRYLTALISYTGRSESDRQAVHTGKAEMRAFF